MLEKVFEEIGGPLVDNESSEIRQTLTTMKGRATFGFGQPII